MTEVASPAGYEKIPELDAVLVECYTTAVTAFQRAEQALAEHEDTIHRIAWRRYGGGGLGLLRLMTGALLISARGHGVRVVPLLQDAGQTQFALAVPPDLPV